MSHDTVAAARLNNTRSSQLLFESPVSLPLTAQQQRSIQQLDFFKKWYLLCHALYITAVVLLGTVVLFMAEPHLALVDAFFIAMSTVCNCGLQTVNVGEWHPGSNFFRHLLMVFGGVVFTSAYQPLLRLVMLHRVRAVFDAREEDTAAERTLRVAKRKHAQRLYCTSVICALTPLVYFAVINGLIALLLLMLNTSNLSCTEVAYMTISSFHSCVFLSMEKYAGDAAVVGLVTAGCALGFTAYPAVLRGFITLERRVYRAARGFLSTPSREFDGSFEGDPLLLDDDLDFDSQEDIWDNAFDDILASPSPGTFHAFLFLPNECAYLAGAWCTLTLMQALPFWVQHWHGLLKGFSPLYKLYLAICQGAVVRFAAASFVPLLQYSNAHIAVTILTMYLPALPISTDRTYRKWNMMMKTSIVRLLTSRLFWLFTAMVSILFAIEPSVSRQIAGTRYDVMTRTFFEVISAYSGCGLSLTLPGADVSFSGSVGDYTKLVIAAVLFGGRHRFVDLGIDLGFGAIQANLQAPLLV